jgi:hypothetical protein
MGGWWWVRAVGWGGRLSGTLPYIFNAYGTGGWWVMDDGGWWVLLDATQIMLFRPLQLGDLHAGKSARAALALPDSA